MRTLSSLQARVELVVEPLLFRLVMALPSWLQRLLAGRPVVVDGQSLSLESQLVLRLQRLGGRPPVESLPIPAARRALARQSAIVGGVQPIGEVRDLVVDGAQGPVRARLYVPRCQVGLGVTDSPLLFFVHGGGWVYCDLDSHEPLCRFLAERAGVRVLSVEYRLAPEDPYPAAYDDCLAAYRWVHRNAEVLGTAPERVAVGGDSAGGHMSALLALDAAREGLPTRFQLLIYPATDMSGTSRSRSLFGDGYFLTTEFMDLARVSYFGDADPADPRISLVQADVPDGVAPAYVATAGFDPLRDEGEAYADKLSAAGVKVEMRRFTGLIHGFANMVGTRGDARAAVQEMAEALAAGVSLGGTARRCPPPHG